MCVTFFSHFSSETVPSKDQCTSNAPSSIVDGSSITATSVLNNDSNVDRPVTPPPSYSEAVSLGVPEASDLSNEEDGMNNKEASSATNPMWYHEGPSSSNKVEREPSEEEQIRAALKNVSRHICSASVSLPYTMESQLNNERCSYD